MSTTIDLLEDAAERTDFWDRTDRGPALADLLEVALEAIDTAAERDQVLQDWLAERNLTIGRIVDMRTDVLDGGGTWETPVAREHIRTLFVLGLDADTVADLLHVDVRDVRAYTATFATGTQEVLRLHAEGNTANEIALRLGLHKQRVHEVLRVAGVQPNVKRQRVTPEQEAHAVTMLQDRCDRADILRATELEPYQLDNVRRRAVKAGRL